MYTPRTSARSLTGVSEPAAPPDERRRRHAALGQRLTLSLLSLPAGSVAFGLLATTHDW
jgi:hypothetical protein